MGSVIEVAVGAAVYAGFIWSCVKFAEWVDRQ